MTCKMSKRLAVIPQKKRFLFKLSTLIRSNPLSFNELFCDTYMMNMKKL